MAESYSVTAILSAKDQNFSSVFGSAQGAADSLAGKLKSGLGFGVLMGIGQKAVNVVTGAVTGLSGRVMETGKSFETAASQIAATMGKPKSEIQDIINEAERLGATTKFTATQAAEGFNILAMSGLDAKQQIATVGDVLNLAAAGAENMDSAAQQVVGTMKGFSMELDGVTDGISNSQYVADLLAKGATLAATDVNALGTALSTVSSNAAQYGQGIQSTEVALLRLAEQNLTGSEAATALSMAMKNIYAPGDKAAETLEKLGVEAYDSTGKARDFNTVVDELNAALREQHGSNEELINQDINQIFDARSARVFGKMVVSDTAKVEEFSNALSRASDGAGAAAEQAATQLDNLEGDMTLFSSATDGLYNAIFKNMNAPMRAFYKVATAALTQVTGLVNSLGDKLAGGIDLGKLQSAIDKNGLAGAVGVLSQDLSGLIPGFKNVAAAAGAFAAVGLANTVLDSGAWKAGAAGVSFFADTMKAVPGKVGGAVSSIVGNLSKFDPASAVKKGLVGTRMAFQNFGKTLDAFGGDLASAMEAISPKLSNAGLKVWGAFEGAGTKISDTATNIVNNVGFGFAGITSKISGAASAITGKIGTIAKPFASIAGAIGGALGKVGGVVLNVGGKLAGGLQVMMGIALKALMPATMVGAALAGLGLLQEKFGDQINSILTMAQEKGPEIISSLANGISSRVPELISQGATLVSNLLNTFGALAPSAVSAGVQIISSLVGGVSQSAPQLITSAVTAVGSFASSVITAIPSLITAGMQLLLSLAQGIAANLPRMTQGAMQAVQNFAQGFIANLPTILTTAGQIVTTLVQGITQSLPGLINGAVGVISTLASGFIQNLPLIVQTGVQVVVALATGLLNAIATLISSIPSIFSRIGNAILTTDWGSVGSQIISAIGNGIMGGISAVGGMVGDFFSGIGDWISGGEKAGEQYAQGCASTIAAKGPEITAATSQTAAEVGISLESIFGASGTQGGTGMVTGLTDTLQSLSPNAVSAAEAMAGDVTSALASGDLESGASDAGQQGVESLASGIESGASAAESAANATVTGVVSAIQSGAQDMLSAGTELASSVIDGFGSGIEPLADAASQAVQSAVSAVQGRLSAMQGAGQQAGAKYAAGIRTGLVQAASAAKTSVNAIVSSLKSSVSPAAAAGKNAGSRYAAGIRSGLSAARGAGTAVGKAAVAGFKTQDGAAKSAGSSLGSGFAGGVRSKTGSAKSAGSSLASAARNGAASGSLYGVGADLARGFVNGIASQISRARAKAAELERVAERVIAAKAKIGSPSKVMKQIGAWFAEGFAIGIGSGERGVSAAAAGVATASIKTMEDVTETHSPSEKAETLGFMIGVGLAKGISGTAGIVAKAAGKIGLASIPAGWEGASAKAVRSLREAWKSNDFLRKAALKAGKWGGTAKKTVGSYKKAMLEAANSGNYKSVANAISKKLKTSLSESAKKVRDNASGIITSAISGMQDKAKKKAENYKALASSAQKAAKELESAAKKEKSSSKKADYKKRAKEQDELREKYEQLAKTYTEKASSISKSSSTIKSAFTTAFNSAVSSAITDVQNRITKLGEKYQESYNKIINARTALRESLQDVPIGERVEDETTGKTTTVLTDYNVMARQVRQYGANLEKLKKQLPEGMMNEILDMETADALAFTNKLLSMSKAQRAAYVKSYNSFISATKSVSTKYYSNKISTLASEYKKAVNTEFQGLKKSLNSIGQDAMKGFVDGMNSKKTSLDSTAKELAESLVKTLKSKLKINSPSKAMKELGSYTGQGFVDGVRDEVAAAREAMAELVEFPSARYQQPAYTYGAAAFEFSEDYSISSNRRYVIETPVVLNGREIARGTAEFNEFELNRRARNSERLRGRR